MICIYCKDENHEDCLNVGGSPTHCDCQHRPRGTGIAYVPKAEPSAQGEGKANPEEHETDGAA